MQFSETPLAGAYLIHPERRADDRGFFYRGWCREEYAAHGLNPAAVQINVARSVLGGTVRGMHFQEAPYQEAKSVRCIRGSIFDVIVDLRPESPTHRKWFGTELSAENGLMLYVPEGFAHGYQTLEDDVEISYLTSYAYVPAAAKGVRFDDPAFAIAWPRPVSSISEADRRWPDYRGHDQRFSGQ